MRVITTLLFVCFSFCLNQTDCRGGGFRSSGGGSRGSSSRYTPRPSSPSRSGSGGSNTQYGWQAPSRTQAPTQTHTSNNSPWKPPTPTSNAGAGSNNNHYGWQVPSRTQTPTQTHSSNNPPAKVPTQTSNNNNNNVWRKPVTTARPNVQQNPTNHAQTNSYGWQKPVTTARPIQHQAVTPSHPIGFQKPITTARPMVQHAPNHAVTPSHPVGFQKPITTARPFTQTQRQQYNTGFNNGKKYEKGFSKGYDTGYQKGLQQGTARVPPAYYPPQNHFGYPGQGFTAGYGSPTYGGHSVFGTPNNYGYGINSGYGYHTYGTGSSGISDMTKGLLIGAAGGYLLNSAIHSFSYSSLSHSHNIHRPTNSWGYDAGGYGSDYKYTKIDNSVTNNYYFSEPPAKNVSSSTSSNESNGPDSWLHCVAYDPMSETTLTNPNCSCTVKVETNSDTNATIAVHSCTSAWGSKTEKTPVSEAEIFEIENAAMKSNKPEKILDSKERQKLDAFKQLETIVNMGCFTC